MKEKLEGKLTVSRVHSSKDGVDYISIEIKYKNNDNHKNILEAKMTVEDFGMAITGMAFCPCVFEITENIDKIIKKE